MVALQHFLIYAWTAVVTLEEADRGELDQVLIADAVTRQEHQVRVGRRGVGDLLARVPAAERQIGLEPQDRADFAGFGFGIERPGAVEVAVVGDGERIHAQRLNPVQQLRNPVGAV